MVDEIKPESREKSGDPEIQPTHADSSDPYEVGYGKPPRHSRFQPGQSGNPRGRPKGTKNLKTDLTEELSEKIVIREGDRSQHISKQRALVKSLVNGSIKGNARATTPLISMMMRLTDTGEDPAELDERIHEDELEILREFKNRVQREVESRVAPPAPSRPDNVEEDETK